MQRVLGTLEPGYRKPKPIFPRSVLGHLFMRKFGLNREQRSLVIRSTGGSSRFLDVERILRASDIEDNHRLDPRLSKVPSRPQRRDTYAVQEMDGDSSSLELPMSDSDPEEVHAAEAVSSQSDDGSEQDELAEIYEIQKRAKRDFKKNVKTYKESKRKVKEIKKSRMGPSSYYPVVAMPPDQAASGSQGSQPIQPKTFKYDRKDSMRKKNDQKPHKTNPKREDANLAESVVTAQFTYMVSESSPGDVNEIFLASIPLGTAILDTGCTTSVVGSDTVQRYTKYFQSCGFPPPVSVELPPVELKGFNGNTETTTSGLRWTVKIGNLHGNVTTYVIAGATPFLLSRRVLEGMNAVIDLGAMTITSAKHGMHAQKLRQASNGHLLLPICPQPDELEIAQCEEECNEPNNAVDVQSNHATCGSLPATEDGVESNIHDTHERVEHVPKSNSKKSPKITEADKRRAFQTIVKNTKNGQVEISKFDKELNSIFGGDNKGINFAAVAYHPKKERIPTTAGLTEFQVSVASLNKNGVFAVSPWRTRPASDERCPVNPMDVAIFAFCLPEQTSQSASDCADQGPTCFCCSQEDSQSTQQPDLDIPVEVLYEDTDWVDLDKQEPLPRKTQKMLRKSIQSLRKASSRMTLSRLASDPSGVRADLQSWLGDQAYKLDQKVGLIEVFTGQANLSKTFEDRSQKVSIRLGKAYGQDFTRLHDRQCLLQLIAYSRPDHLWFSFPCTCWSPWTHINMSRDPKTRDEILRQRKIALRYLHCVSECWHLQRNLGGHAHCENPLASQAWAELNLGRCWDVRVDQCALGLRSPKSDVPILKPTRIVTTQESLAQGLLTCRCDGKHQHEHLSGSYKGKNLTSWAESYPRKFCRTMVNLMLPHVSYAKPIKSAEEILAEEEDELEQLDQPVVQVDQGKSELDRARALVRKVHVNTGHSSKEQLQRLAFRCQSSKAIMQAIKEFTCPICEELKRPALHRKAAMPHAETPNQVVAIDFVQVELKRESRDGTVEEVVRNVLTVVDLATDFCQQIVVPREKHALSKAFHKVWGRPYGVPKTVFMDPDHRAMSSEWQRYLVRNNIQLLYAAAESHWQLGKVEVVNRILRGMAQRVWLSGTNATPEETIEACASIRNEQLRKHGFSPLQWFLGREPRHAGSLADVDEQRNIVSQSQVLADPTFSAKLHLREIAAKAFLEEHARDTWRRAVGGRNRPMRGPYTQGQMVYMYRSQGRGQLSTRHGAWLGPARIIGTESSTDGVIPRLIWVSYNGFLY